MPQDFPPEELITYSTLQLFQNYKIKSKDLTYGRVLITNYKQPETGVRIEGENLQLLSRQRWS